MRIIVLHAEKAEEKYFLRIGKLLRRDFMFDEKRKNEGKNNPEPSKSASPCRQCDCVSGPALDGKFQRKIAWTFRGKEYENYVNRKILVLSLVEFFSFAIFIICFYTLCFDWVCRLNFTTCILEHKTSLVKQKHSSSVCLFTSIDESLWKFILERASSKNKLAKIFCVRLKTLKEKTWEKIFLWLFLS